MMCNVNEFDGRLKTAEVCSELVFSVSESANLLIFFPKIPPVNMTMPFKFTLNPAYYINTGS